MRGKRFLSFLTFGPVVLGLAACNQTATRAPASAPSGAASGATAAGVSLPGNAGCAGEINRFRTVLTSDVQTGNVNRSVYERVTGDLDQASAACSAGRDGEAIRLVNATKQRHGYR